jgi:hypothetical protein
MCGPAYTHSIVTVCALMVPHYKKMLE